MNSLSDKKSKKSKIDLELEYELEKLKKINAKKKIILNRIKLLTIQKNNEELLDKWNNNSDKLSDLFTKDQIQIIKNSLSK